MFFRLIPRLFLTALFVTITLPAFSQTVPAANQGGLPLVVGVGLSDYNIDFGAGRRMEGVSAWADWNFDRAPSFLRGFGIEAVGHHIAYGLPTGFSQMRQDSGEGGPIYTVRRYRNVHPYAKFLVGLGGIDFPKIVNYSHDTRTISSLGGGVDYRAWRDVWVRGDYEYQIWPDLFGRGHALTPNGFTIGAEYDFRGRNRR
jgi:hypothetical protein